MVESLELFVDGLVQQVVHIELGVLWNDTIAITVTSTRQMLLTKDMLILRGILSENDIKSTLQPLVHVCQSIHSKNYTLNIDRHFLRLAIYGQVCYLNQYLAWQSIVVKGIFLV